MIWNSKSRSIFNYTLAVAALVHYVIILFGACTKRERYARSVAEDHSYRPPAGDGPIARSEYNLWAHIQRNVVNDVSKLNEQDDYYGYHHCLADQEVSARSDPLLLQRLD